jgi:hypothetical protein
MSSSWSYAARVALQGGIMRMNGWLAAEHALSSSYVTIKGGLLSCYCRGMCSKQQLKF